MAGKLGLTASQPVRVRSDPAFAPPQNPVETTVAGIWARVLGVDPIGRQDEFLDLGGDSVFATQIISQIRDAFQVEVPMMGFLETITVASLAMTILQLQSAKADPDELSQMLSELEKLSDAEAVARLGSTDSLPK
jgi:acyl carrier protein